MPAWLYSDWLLFVVGGGCYAGVVVYAIDRWGGGFSTTDKDGKVACPKSGMRYDPRTQDRKCPHNKK